MTEFEVTSKTLEDYALRHGIKGRRILSILGKNQQFLNAMSSPVGQEFLKRLIARSERNRILYDNMDIDSSGLKFAEIRARYNESFDILQEFLVVCENQEELLKQLKEE